MSLAVAKVIPVGFLCVALIATSAGAEDQQWGDLTGRFIFDGEPPKRIELKVNKDQEVVKKPILDESLIVDAKTHGLANVFVWLIDDPEEPVEVHPDYSKAKSEPVVVKMSGLRFEPHCVVFRTGQKVKFLNQDGVGHNPNFQSPNNVERSSLIPAGNVEKILKNSESAPIPVSCNIHSWMSCYYLCRDNHYMTLSSTTGEFTIKNLPVGRHSFRIWHEMGGFLAKARRNGEQREWKMGRIELDIRPGKNDLGDVLVPAGSLKRK